MKKVFFTNLFFMALPFLLVIAARADISQYELLGKYPAGGRVLDIKVKDNIAYLPIGVGDGTTTSKLEILDVANPENIVLLGSITYTLPSSSWGVDPVDIILNGDYAYISNWCGGFVVIDVSNKGNPQLISSYSDGCGSWGGAMSGLLIDGNIMYVGWDYNFGLGIFDISNPGTPKKITNYGEISYARFVEKKDDYVYVSTYYGGAIRIFNVSNPSSPTLVNSIPTPGSAYYVGDIVGNYYYLPDTRNAYGIKIYDVTNAAQPAFVSQIKTQALGVGWIRDIKVYGDEAIATFLVPGTQTASVVSFDISNPFSPKVNSILDLTPNDAAQFEYTGGRLYIPGGFNGMMSIWGVPYIAVTVDIKPNTVDLKSKGNWVTCYIEVPTDYNVYDINTATIKIIQIEGKNIEPIYALGSSSEIGDYDSDNIPDLMVKFDRQKLQEVLPTGGFIDIVITAELMNQKKLKGMDEVRVIHGTLPVNE